MIPLNNLSSRTKYEKNDFLNLTSPLITRANLTRLDYTYLLTTTLNTSETKLRHFTIYQ